MTVVNRNFKRLRKAAGMSQEELAEKLCISQAMISKVERGYTDPSVKMCFALAKLLKCPLIEIFEGS